MKVKRVDHVHLYVRDRDSAAVWYEQTLGLSRCTRLDAWSEHPNGPLMLEGGDGEPAVALFADPNCKKSRCPTVAFRTDASGFLSFLDNLSQRDLRDEQARCLSGRDIVDHDLAWSIYFHDPDGNALELTTYDYDDVARGRQMRR
ncbi:VOC family protein [Boseongicola sp. H5]|uniref:VOC family protein n=1 Tax=Boseongicola sp. H5 TaxID=2763261 RepID=UPI001D0ABD9B|nr:VOC family protein [Boseongicola sp. H5]